jgi:predicted metal-binding protein
MAKKKKPSRQAASISDAQVVQMAMANGALAAKVIKPAAVETAEWVRWKCQFGCGCYGSSLVCPPHSPAPQQTRTLLDGYSRAVFFEAPRGQPKGVAVALERELFLAGFYKAFGLGAGPCQLCNTCALDAGCLHPYQARPAMEACGVDVYATARKHGFTLNVVRNHKDEQHYFGLVLIE